MKKVLFLLLALLVMLSAETVKTAENVSSATLTIETEPAGVSVIIDNKETVKAPFTKELPTGSHLLLFKKKGYYGKKIKLNLKEGDVVSRKITLRAPGILTLHSEPTGATVVLNNETLGVTPFTSKPLKPGSYSLALQKEGFVPLEKEVRLTSGENKELSLSLNEITTAPDTSVSDTSVSDTSVSDTIASDTIASDTIASDTIASDTIASDTIASDTSVSDTSVSDTIASDTIASDTIASEVSELKSGLSLSTTPDSVFVIIDAKDTLVSPFTTKLSAGEHELVLKKKGYYAKKVRITIPEDTLISQQVSLRAPAYLSISANVDSCRILVNKESVGTTPYTSKAMKAGTYEIIVLKSGYKTDRRSVTVTEGEHKKVTLSLESKGEVVAVKSSEEIKQEKKERKKVAIIAGAVFAGFLTMLTAFELSGVGE